MKKISMLLMLAVTSTAVAADDATVYESLAEVQIGRVFFSPEHRALLDTGNRSTSQAPRKPAATPRARRRPNSDAAGYIVSSSGRARVYSDGDFVATDAKQSVRFPGEVRVLKKRLPEPQEHAKDASDTGAAESSDDDK